MTTRPKEILTRSRYPVSSFGAELLSSLLRGARERVEIPCPDQRTMQRLQARIHMLRAAMRREHHPQTELVTRARTARTWDRGQPNSNCVLIIQPHDAEFESIFRAAGIKATEHTRDLLNDIESPPTGGDDSPITDVPDPYARFKGDDK